MNYFIFCNGQEYGPYTPADLQKYLADGSIRPSDQARTEDMRNWVPLSQLLGGAGETQSPPSPPTQPPAWTRAEQRPQQGPLFPLPPSMHWGLVLLLTIVTCGLFALIWLFIQASWVKKIDPVSRSTFFLGVGLALLLGGYVVIVVGAVAMGVGGGGFDPEDLPFMAMLLLCYPLLIIGSMLMWGGILDIRSSLEIHFNTVEPIKLRLSGPLTAMFAVFYYQYHLTRIHTWKTTGYLSPSNIRA
jgi:hypothetical protein